MLGRCLNTHQQWLCRNLSDRGYLVHRQIAVDDAGPAIAEAVSEAMSAADLIIVTGGLGPTSDDQTRDRIASLLGVSLKLDAAVLEHIESFFKERHRTMPDAVQVQAMVPEGATVFPNTHGTAPGLVIEFPRSKPKPKSGLLILLPGPPRELYPMFLEQALPMIAKRFPAQGEFVCVTLRTTGMGESLVEQEIAAPLRHLTVAGLSIGYCARPGEVDVRLAAQGTRAGRLVAEARELVRRAIGEIVFTEDGAELEEVIIRLLTERRQTLVTGESCTGGLVGHRLTNVPGASAVFLGGFVAYSNEAKAKFLGVRFETLGRHGAVSEETAREMAEGARARMGATFGISVTGIAGPTGGTEMKPVGTVYVGLARDNETVVRRYLNPYDRETFKAVTAQQALELLRRTLIGERKM